MEEQFLDVGRLIDKADVEKLRKRLQDMKPGDKIVIKMESSDAHQSDILRRELTEQGFDYHPHGGHGREYYLMAKKQS